MGDFGVTCVASHLAITTGKTKLIVLIPSHRKAKGRNAILSFDDLPNHPSSCYTAFCLPITGRYDSYGRIEEIEKSPTTEIIEEFFDMKIERFIDLICDMSNKEDIKELKITDDKKELLEKLSPCFVIDEVYTKFSEIFLGNDTSEMLQECFLTPEGLLELGFERTNPEETHGQILLRNKRYPSYKCSYYAGTLSYSHVSVERGGDYCNTVLSLMKTFKKHQKKDIFEVFGSDKRKQNAYRLMYASSLYASDKMTLHNTSNLYQVSSSQKRFVDQEYVRAYEYLTFFYMLYSANLTLMPKYSGEQYGNPLLELAITEEKLRIFNKHKHTFNSDVREDQ